MKKNLVIVTSKENYVWTSMTEIIPWIEHAWKEWARSRNIEVSVIHVDTLSMSETLKALMNADLMVVTCFNLKVARFISKIREDLSFDVKMAFYLHNQATIACWPLLNWKIIGNMTENDTFIGTCSRDLSTMKLLFHNAHTEILPFSLPSLPQVSVKQTFQTEIRKFTYIGRISTQKNLHTLFWSLGLLKEKEPGFKWEFHLFGEDDELGSPLMGLAQIHYKEYLQELVQKFNIKEEVKFRGFISREEIEKEMSHERWIFVSPSLHGDENFGMAAFRCLTKGHLAVLSDWGGHSDFLTNFPSQTHRVRVYQSDFGPWIDAYELTMALVSASKNDEGHDSSLSYYHDENLHSQMDKIWNANRKNSKLHPNPLASDILKRRQHFVEVHEKLILQNRMLLKESQRFSQIFENYADKTAHVFHQTYGMENLKFIQPHGETKISPWVSGNEKITVKDPHRGEWTFENKDEIFLAENGWATVIRRY